MRSKATLNVICGLHCLLFLIVIGISSPAISDEPGTVDLQSLSDELSAVPDMRSLIESCPADIWQTWQTWHQRLLNDRNIWDDARCRADVAACVKACTSALSGSACRAAALVFETDGSPSLSMTARRGYALACALGEASGCTNRAAGIANAPIPEDWLSQDRSEENRQCLRRSYATACAAEDAWGCTMEGFALQYGEGGPIDLDAARAQYRRACALSPGPEDVTGNAAPCNAARQALEMLGEAD